ncbi:MAG: Dabb family protein [Deltaproteobacteria bacterium]|nr:Dabb family protein [Deltaproteobacteria bacterium]
MILLTTHDGTASLRAFRTEPKHLEIVEFINKVAASRKCLDWEIQPKEGDRP